MPKGLALHNQLRNGTIERGVEDSSPIRTAAVLTCVGGPQPPDAFRPAFCDRQQRIYLARDLKRERLPAAAATPSIPEVRQYVRFTQRPWVGTGFFGFEGPVENMPQYGREYGRVAGMSALLLCTGLKPEQKEPLLINLVQVGIDLGGMVRAGHPGWTGFGGHGSGRKLPIVFAGLLLGDDPLANINKSFPTVSFGEDEQTAYAECWTGAKVVFAGHSAIDEATGIARERGQGWGRMNTARPRNGKRARTPARAIAAAAPAWLGSPKPWPCASCMRSPPGTTTPSSIMWIAGWGKTTPRSSRKSRKPPARITTNHGPAKASPGSPLPTKCGPATAQPSRPPPMPGTKNTTRATT
jgi:hypothetical protein